MEQYASDLLVAIESVRRAKKYPLLLQLTGPIIRQFFQDTPEKCLIRSRVKYELHMGAYDVAMKYVSDTRAPDLMMLKSSLRFAEESAGLADQAGDPLGRLFAEMNIAGLIWPELGKWEIAIGKSGDVATKAEEIARAPTTSKIDKARAWRVVLNARLHQIHNTIKYRKDFTAPYDVRDWLSCVRNNPLYLENKDDFQAAIEAAEKFLQT